MSGQEHHDEYGETFVAGLEWMWGDGFLSPGGAEEVGRIVDGVPIAGARVLDVGCGLGAIDILLAERFGAAHVTGIDVEAPLVAKARARVEAAGMADDRVSIRKVRPGPFPFEDDSFDVVFSKDSMIHIPDKRALYADIFRVLVPGGWMAVSDWFGNGLEPTPAMRDWLDVVALTFELESIETSAGMVGECGFTDIEWRDRNAWYAEAVDAELATLTGANFARLVERLGVGRRVAAAGKHDEEEGGRRWRRASSGAPARAQAGLRISGRHEAAVRTVCRRLHVHGGRGLCGLGVADRLSARVRQRAA